MEYELFLCSQEADRLSPLSAITEFCSTGSNYPLSQIV